MMPEVRVLAPEALVRAAAERVAAAARRALERRGAFTLALAGGSTPRPVYTHLADAHGGEIDWSSAHIFWGDERCVPPDHPASNYRMAREALLGRVPLPAGNVHRIRGELGPAEAADGYDAELGEFFGAARPAALSEPAFDLVLLGVGGDGHTASLFPSSAALHSERWAAPVEAPPDTEPRERVTLTLAALGAAREAVFLATGEEKREAVRAALAAEPDTGGAPPAGRVRPRAGVAWFLDAEANG